MASVTSRAYIIDNIHHYKSGHCLRPHLYPQMLFLWEKSRISKLLNNHQNSYIWLVLNNKNVPQLSSVAYIQDNTFVI